MPSAKPDDAHTPMFAGPGLSDANEEEENDGFPDVLADGWRAYLERSLTTLILEEKLNLFMLFTPFAVVSRSLEWGDGITFFFALLAIAPFAERISFVTEQLAMYTNDTLGGLLNATFGNVTELIVSLFALHHGLLHIVQVNLLGSVLSNLLLVLGGALFFGGLKNETQHFNRNAASMNSSLLMLAAMSILFPTSIQLSGAELHHHSILLLSRVMSILLLIVYAAFLYFQLATHRHLFEGQEEDEGEQDFILGFWGAIFWLAIITICIAVLSEIMVDAIEGAADSWGVPDIFIGVIVIPIVGNAAEHAAAIIFALKNKMDIALGIAVGSATQIALSVIPACVLIAWAMDRPLAMNFEGYEAATMFASCTLVAIVTTQGQTNWLQGLVLVTAYVLLAAGFLVHK
mmetsp:Transcript_26873/g.79192  ORF Transcript_26873/g.79192 Transcript_26873/m.79192 type:complete len:403 (-) Transcript_26873:320-1528(-)|eukprot:CAMPEP_0206044290 /NCGR_PEP_ID=MMETSP1466-20131121/12247_1 /ASSEMBLY_ACC=CAM_ASM_001126 /TAXON_ID=44452 /ORGANISM="Pavlova gyrans, Strain CCMP608" /LENGTH=402 /DNA_ID=CAMNT_0053419175 /DNA_START=46 /DNA_END=1254 /DNA_ORIENTATION=+